jgi:hypothetical protein
MRRPQQRDERRSRPFRDREREEKVDRCDERLGRERERVQRVVRKPRIIEYLSRQVQVRQRPLKHDGRVVARRSLAAHERARDRR